MSDHKSFIRNALEYYDKNIYEMNDALERGESYKFTSMSKDTEKSVVTFYDKDNKKIFSSRFEVVGTYTEPLELWAWSWAIPTIHKNMSYMSRRLLMYGLDLDYITEGKNLKTELITSRFRIANKMQIDLHLAIAAYLTKQPYIFEMKPMTNDYSHDKQDFGKFIYIHLLDFREWFESEKKNKSTKKS